MKRNRAPDKQDHRRGQDEKPVFQCEIDKPANHLLLHGILEDQRISNDSVACLDPGNNLLHVSRKHLSGRYFNAVEFFVIAWNIDPISIVQMQNCSCRHRRIRDFSFPMESGGHEHSHFHDSRILHLDSHFGGPDIGIEDRQNLADSSDKNLVGVGIQPNLCGFTNMYMSQIVFVHVTHDPNIRKIGDRERIR